MSSIGLLALIELLISIKQKPVGETSPARPPVNHRAPKWLKAKRKASRPKRRR